MKTNKYLIILLLSIILICSCLSNIKIKKIIENYDNEQNARYFLHNDTVQNMTMNNIQEQINQNNEKLTEIETNKNLIQNNIDQIQTENENLRNELNRLITIAEDMA